MPFAKRDPQTRQTSRLPAVVARTSDVSAVPEYPHSFPESMQREWEALWTSPMSLVWDPVTDYGIVERLFFLKIQFKLQSARSDGTPADTQALLAIGRELRLVEAQLGLTPRSRLSLGLALFAGKKQAGLDDYMVE